MIRAPVDPLLAPLDPDFLAPQNNPRIHRPEDMVPDLYDSGSQPGLSPDLEPRSELLLELHWAQAQYFEQFNYDTHGTLQSLDIFTDASRGTQLFHVGFFYDQDSNLERMEIGRMSDGASLTKHFLYAKHTLIGVRTEYVPGTTQVAATLPPAEMAALEMELAFKQLPYYKKFSHDKDGALLSIGIYTDPQRTTKLFDRNFTYTPAGDLATIRTVRTGDGATLTKTVSFTGGLLTSIEVN